MTHLKRSSSLFFIPLVPYPARSARHLPHAGKALSVVILFPKYTCIRFDDARIAASSYRSLPHWERGTASAVDRVLSQTAYLRRFLFHLYHLLETIFLALFHTASTLSGSLRSPPSPRGEGFVTGKRRPRFFIHRTQKRPALASGRFNVVYYWLSFFRQSMANRA